VPDQPPSHGSVTATSCQLCATPLAGRADQQFCSPSCRQKAHRRRTRTPPTRTPVLPAGTSRRDITIYECDDCGERLIGQQWCPDCQRPCRRLDFGGPCPSCGDAITIADLVGSPMT
jgi:hypothetical protein